MSNELRHGHTDCNMLPYHDTDTLSESVADFIGVSTPTSARRTAQWRAAGAFRRTSAPSEHPRMRVRCVHPAGDARPLRAQPLEQQTIHSPQVRPTHPPTAEGSTLARSARGGGVSQSGPRPWEARAGGSLKFD